QSCTIRMPGSALPGNSSFGFVHKDHFIAAPPDISGNVKRQVFGIIRHVSCFDLKSSVVDDGNILVGQCQSRIFRDGSISGGEDIRTFVVKNIRIVKESTVEKLGFKTER